jgi:hypothetical protein
MLRVARVVILSVAVSGCAFPFFQAKPGLVGGPVFTMWVAPDKFVYVPGPPEKNFAFETPTTRRVIAPGMMYTDGGSIPRAARILKGFSPWDFGPAYIIHDWIFYGRHCYVDPDDPKYEDEKRFADVNGIKGSRPITFEESALILAQVIKTLIDNGQANPWNTAGQLISSAVDSTFAAALWDAKGACKTMRVEPLHIAMVWLTALPDAKQPPSTWKLSKWEVEQARLEFPRARDLIRSLDPTQLPPQRNRLLGPLVSDAGRSSPSSNLTEQASLSGLTGNAR